MKINLSLSDDLFETYVKRFGLPNCYAQMRRAIEVFKNVESSDRYIFLSGDARRAVEAIFETTVNSGEDLAKRVSTLNRFRIGGVDIAFNEAELQRIDAQAGFHGQTRDQFVQNMAEELKNMMLDKV